MCGINGFNFKDLNLLLKYYNKELVRTLKKKYLLSSPFVFWQRSELNEYAKCILSKNYYNSLNIINLEECQKLFFQNKKNYYDSYLLWNVINMQIFLRKHKF